MDHSPDPAELGSAPELIPPVRNVPWRRVLLGEVVQGRARCYEGTRAKQNRYCVAPARETGAHECTGPQEHLDAVISFAGAGQRRRLFRGLDVLTIKWAIGDLPEECRFLVNTQLMFLKTDQYPTTKLFDDDEWIRSLTEAQKITADVSEDSVKCVQHAVDPKKVRPIQTEEVLRKCV